MAHENVKELLTSYNGDVIAWLNGLITRGLDSKPPLPTPPPIELEDLIRLREIMQYYQEKMQKMH
jgi:hypothetical protein